MDDYIVRIVRLPMHIHGFTMPDENGDYNIYLNDRLSDAELVRAYDHEVKHIEAGHFYDDMKTVSEKEKENDPEEDPIREVARPGVSGQA